jgi:CheY-like chemotaxis protein/two-component sensor histidine kinase
MLAHELRNPLAPIRNAVQLLQLIGPPEPRLRQLRDMMDRQVRHLTRLVDDLLDVSRISRGKLELRKERVALSAVVRSAVETARPLIDAGKHELSIVEPPTSPAVEADLVRLAQAVANLLNNSARYTPERGHIVLAVEMDQSQAVIRVQDDGAGIPRHMLARVFEVFTQVDRRVERAQGGLGIGLALVQRLVEMHGGTVEARSEGEGKGSEFIVRLPLAAEAAEPEQPTMVPDGAQGMEGPRRRILVVDDNQDSADSLRQVLEFIGHDVRAVYDGRSALEIVAALQPDVVLLDIGLPGMSGYEVARKMREMPELRGVFLVAQTGWGQDKDRRKTKEAGFDVHLVKPVRLEALERLLATLEPAR